MTAVQRALTEYGYGQLKPTGAIGADTQTAIQKFEREREEYYATTLGNAWSGFNRPSF